MPEFEHLRHKPPTELTRERQIILACAPMRSNVNISTIVRTAGCFGIGKIILCGTNKVDRKIARDGADSVEIENRSSLVPVIKKHKEQGYHAVGLEQTTGSQSLYSFAFPEKTLLVIGSERDGLKQDVLDQLDTVVEIPVYGMPYSYNVGTAASICLYEYCKQHS